MVTTDPAAASHNLDPTPDTRPESPATITGRFHRPLLCAVAVMAVVTACSAIGMMVDERTLLGEPLWLKPFKFGVAFVLYSLTLAWLLSLPHTGRRVTWWMGTVFAVTGIIDVGFIVLQAARGTFSHFNTETDAVNSIGQIIFASGVPGLFVANLILAVVVSWRPRVDRPTVWAIRSGLALAVVGMALGYTMGFTGTQVVRAADGRVIELAAGHTVVDARLRAELSAPDAAPGLPITGWSTAGGDLRIPHFLGLHGIQVLLAAVVLTAWLAHRHPSLRDERFRTRLIGLLALGWAGAIAITYWQAMRGLPLLRPDGAVLLAAGTTAALLAGGFAAVTPRHPTPSRRPGLSAAARPRG